LIGLEEEGEIVAGYVTAPALSQGTRWWAFRGEGAFRDGKKIHVSKITRMNKDLKARAKIRQFADSAGNSRALGGFLHHMLVAEGAIEAAVDWFSKPW